MTNRISANQTYWPGVLLYGATGALVGWIIYRMTGNASFFGARPWGVYLRGMLSIGIAGLLAMALLEKMKFSVKLGERALLKYLGNPTSVEFLPGEGFLLPFTEVEQKKVQGIEVGLSGKDFVTGNGFELNASLSSVVMIEDIAKAALLPTNVDEYISNQLESAARQYILGQVLDLKTTKINKGSADKEAEAIEISKTIAVFKAKLKKNANDTSSDESIVCLMNNMPNGLKSYGLKATQALILNAEFMGKPEEAAQRILAEIIEEPALIKDADNKMKVVKTMLDSAKAMGVDLSTIPSGPARVEKWIELVSLAAAMEGKGVGFQRFSGLGQGTRLNVNAN